MTQIRYEHLDVFADGPYGGHALIVCLGSCPDSVMAALSHEFNLVVAFPRLTSPRRYRLRIIEHGHELPFGAQPTIGAAWALGPGTWRQESMGASVEVEVMDRGARMGIPDPVLERITDESLLAGILDVLGLASSEGAYRASCGGNTHLLVPTQEDIAQVRADPRAVTGICETAGMNTLSPFCWDRAGGDLSQRIFAPRMGIPESPAVGTAAAPAAEYARDAWGAGTDVCVRQGQALGRPSLITVHAERGAMNLMGNVRRFAQGTFTLG
jgi:trans-2,3-dihydro-3-hydroxyanthranilate isomerase